MNGYRIIWLDNEANTVVCSYRAYKYFGGEIFGIIMEPDMYCPDYYMYGIDDYRLAKEQGLFFLSTIK